MKHERLVNNVARVLYEKFLQSISVHGHPRSDWFKLTDARKEPYRKQARQVIELLMGPGQWRRITRDDIPGHVSFYKEKE